MSDPPSERRGWPPIIWACLALPLWATGAVLPAGVWKLTSGAPPEAFPYGLMLFGLLVSTPLILRVDARVGPGIARRWTAPAPWFLWAAAVAGMGATILVSELHNVLAAMTQAPLDVRTPPEGNTALIAVLSIAQPVCLVVVLQGVVQHTFHSALPIRAAVIATLAVAAFFGFGMALRTVPLLLLPAWLYAQSRTLAPAMASLLPAGIATSLEAMGIGMGIAGFDRIGPQAQWQPLWFNALGLVLLIGGLMPLIKAFTAKQD